VLDISIISPGASLADARLHRIVNALIRDGKSVEIFAIGNPQDAPKGATIRTINQSKGFLWRMHRAFYSPWRASGQILYTLAPEAQLFTWAAALIKRRAYCADVYEDYLSLLKDRKWAKRLLGLPGAIASLLARSGTAFAARSAMVTVADVQVPPFTARQRILLRNLPDATHLIQSGSLSTKPRALYIGDVRESRGLHTMLQAAALAPEWSFDIVGPISENDAAWIHLWSIQNEDAASRVTFHGRLAPEKSWQLAHGAWVGLSLLEPTPAFIAAIPSKIYEYMSVGLATITTPLPRCADLISQSQAGAVADGPASVAAILQGWQRDPAEIEKVRANGAAWARQNLDAEGEYRLMTQAIDRVLHRVKG